MKARRYFNSVSRITKYKTKYDKLIIFHWSILSKISLYGVFCFLGFLFSCNYEQKTKIEPENTIKISSDESKNEDVLTIGVAAMLSPENALPVYEEMIDYIGEELNVNIKMLFTKDYKTMNDLVKSKEVVAAFVCSGPYVTGHDNWGMELVAVPSLYDTTVYYSYIIVNKANDITNFKELKGKKFAFTDPKSNTGKLVPTYELARIGTTPDDFFSEYIFTTSHDKSIEAVAQKLVDGAAVDHLIWEYLNNTDSTFTSRTKIIAKLGPFAMPPFVVHPDCDSLFKTELRKVLLEMHTNPKGKKILNEIYMDKFVMLSDSDYQSIREMNKWIEKVNQQADE